MTLHALQGAVCRVSYMEMNVADLRSLFAYNEWANERVFAAVEPLSEEQYARPLAGSFASIRETLAHIVGAEWIWLQRWNGHSPTQPPAWMNGATRESLLGKLGEIEDERAVFVESLDDQDLGREVTYTNLQGKEWTYPLRDLLVHMVNHSTYHRGQIATMVRQVGGTPVSTDLLVFKDQLAS